MASGASDGNRRTSNTDAALLKYRLPSQEFCDDFQEHLEAEFGLRQMQADRRVPGLVRHCPGSGPSEPTRRAA